MKPTRCFRHFPQPIRSQIARGGRMGSRTAWIFLAAALGTSTGCQALGLGRSGPTPPPLAQQSLTVDEIVARNNQTVQSIAGFQAHAGVALNSNGRGGSVRGVMTVEKPRNFRMRAGAALSDDADIGSNDELFWVWMKNRKDRKIYIGYYDQTGSAPGIGEMFQPDWVIEALGFHEITPDEQKDITLERGRDPATLVLEHRRYDAEGKPSRKTTIVDAKTGRVREHLFYGPGKNGDVLLARAVAKDYQRIPVQGDDRVDSVVLPRRVQVEWLQPDQPPLVVDVTINDPKIVALAPKDREALFTPPRKPGYEIVRLNEIPRGERLTERTPRSSSIELSTPLSLDDDEAARASGGFSRRRPPPSSIDRGVDSGVKPSSASSDDQDPVDALPSSSRN